MRTKVTKLTYEKTSENSESSDTTKNMDEKKTILLRHKGAVIYSVPMGRACLEICRQLQPRLLKLQKCTSYAEAIESHKVGKACWYPHQSRFGPTKRLVLTAVDPDSDATGYSFSNQTSPGIDWNAVPGLKD